MKTSEIENIYQHWYADNEIGKYEKIQSGWREKGAYYKAKNIASSFKCDSSIEILDIGGGMGEVSEVLVSKFSFPPTNLVEISSTAVKFAKQKDGVKEAKVFDGYTIDLPDRSIDFGFATHVLEHVPDPRRFLREIHRVCKRVFIEIPIDYSNKIPTQHLLSYGHVNVFTPSTARFLLESEGFKVEKEFASFTQVRYDMTFYNYFYNNSNSINVFTLSKFFAKEFYYGLKRFISRSMPSEYCFVLIPDDNFEITSMVDIQRAKRSD